MVDKEVILKALAIVKQWNQDSAFDQTEADLSYMLQVWADDDDDTSIVSTSLDFIQNEIEDQHLSEEDAERVGKFHEFLNSRNV